MRPRSLDCSRTEIVHGLGMVIERRRLVPLERELAVGFTAAAVLVHDGERVLRARQAHGGRVRKVLERLGVVLLDAPAIGEHHAQSIQRQRIGGTTHHAGAAAIAANWRPCRCTLRGGHRRGVSERVSTIDHRPSTSTQCRHHSLTRSLAHARTNHAAGSPSRHSSHQLLLLLGVGGLAIGCRWGPWIHDVGRRVAASALALSTDLGRDRPRRRRAQRRHAATRRRHSRHDRRRQGPRESCSRAL